MQIILGASCVFVCDSSFSILENGAVVFQTSKNQILEVGDFEELKLKYPNAQASFYDDCVLLPALSNAHIHFEFSNNQSQLIYGDFPSWLSSVITQREALFENLEQSIQREIELQLQSGVASVGAISSHGYDIELLAKSPLRVTLFNEAIGSNPQILDALYGNLKERLQECERLKNARFRPALAIHSPYSTHFVLAKKVALLAEEKNLKISAHFLESKEERQWLYEKNGWFKDFFASFFGISNARPTMDAQEFLALFKHLSPLLVHCLFADSQILLEIAKMYGFVVSAPRSNRLLNGKYLDILSLKEAKLHPIFSTDGLSSNYSLNLIEEIRNAFFGYSHLDTITLAKDLILGITRFPALALGNQNGELSAQKLADLAIFECRGIKQSQQKPLHFVLHASIKAKELYIQGERVWKN